jgi:hypothetical protein
MQAELWCLAAVGYEAADRHQIQSLELIEGDTIGPFQILARGPREALFFTSMSTITWLSCESEEGERGPELELRLGSMLSGGAYRGVPLHIFLWYKVAVPLHGLYSRLLLQAAAHQLAYDSTV